MKKIFFLMILIGSTLSLLGSCAKDDDDAASTAAGDLAGTGTTASGTITGHDNLTGTFHFSYYGQEPSGGCVDNSSAVSGHSYFASDTKSFKKMWIITGSSSFTTSEVQYSDENCSTMTLYFNMMADNVTIGTALTGLTGGSNPTKPTSAYKISYQFTKYSLMANTTATIASFASRFGMTVTSGEEKKVDEENIQTEYNIIAAEKPSWDDGNTYLFLATASGADNITDWTSNTDLYWK